MRRLVWPHFASPETMKLSMITWAALAKSPNCASQRTSEFGRGGRVAVLEAEAGDLRERAVVELERGRGVLEVLHRRVLEAGVLVVEDEVAVGEGAALGVLAGEADVDALGQQRGEGERLGLAEVDPALLERLDPLARAGGAACGGR